MTAIAKNHQNTVLTPSPATAGNVAGPTPLWIHLCAKVQLAMDNCRAHPARTVVLLPFYQLQTTARQAGMTQWSAGFTPRWETTKSWSQRVGCFVHSTGDVRFDMAYDSLQAADFLARAGLGNKQSMLLPALVAAAQQLGTAVAAIAPNQRPAWALQARAAVVQGLEANPLAYEAAVARIALEWALASRYETDILFDPAVGAQFDCLVVVDGLQSNPLAAAVASHWSAKSSVVVFDAPLASGQVQLHAVRDAHDEADRGAACIVEHIRQGHTPVALATVDRVLTRRISATLALHGVPILDETGWKLSTTRAAAALMALLRAATWKIGSTAGSEADDAWLDWLKHTSVDSHSLDTLEKSLRGLNRAKVFIDIAIEAIEFIADDGLKVHADDVLKNLQRPKAMSQWLDSLSVALRQCGMWTPLSQDEAGADCMAALHLDNPQDLASYTDLMGLADFTAWVQATLEAASFKARQAQQSDALVVVLPLAQILARPFASLVLAGADEQRLPRGPEPVGSWSNAQRLALGLADRDTLAAEQASVWACALTVPYVDILWRQTEGEQVLQPSVWVQALVAGSSLSAVHPGPAVQPGKDPRTSHSVQVKATARPAPTAAVWPIQHLSASAYDDLRTCPYRYFALRLLGLQDAPELDAAVSKRDFGSWLHAVLADFHLRRKEAQGQDPGGDAALLDQCAAAQRQPGSGFIPFAASWPQVRDSYMLWLAQHEAQGWQFDVGELPRERSHAGVQLVGRLDRVDRLSRGPTAGTAMVLDYKTESTQTSKDRVRDPLEDTQLAFYAALLGEEDTEAAYINIAERSTSATPQNEVMLARDALLAGIESDITRLRAGQPMPALGDGKSCDFCAARGLCRKDFWAV